MAGSTFDGMVNALSEGFIPIEAWRIGKGELLEWSVEYTATDRLSLVSVKDSGGWRVRTSGEAPEELILVIPSMGATLLSGLPREVVGTPGTLLLINNHEPSMATVPIGPSFSESLRLDWATITQAYAAAFEAPLIGSLDISQALNLADPPAALLYGIWRTIYVGMNNDGLLLRSPIALSNLTEALADLIIRTVAHSRSHRLGQRISLISPKHVRHAIEYMRAAMDQPLLVREIAQRTGVSVRALEIGFRTFKGCSPTEYLRGLRLQAVRDDLLDPYNQDPISAICLKRGFFHFGRFSGIYRAAYGEKPSETRQRRGVIFTKS